MVTWNFLQRQNLLKNAFFRKLEVDLETLFSAGARDIWLRFWWWLQPIFVL